MRDPNFAARLRAFRDELAEPEPLPEPEPAPADQTPAPEPEPAPATAPDYLLAFLNTERAQFFLHAETFRIVGDKPARGAPGKRLGRAAIIAQAVALVLQTDGGTPSRNVFADGGTSACDRVADALVHLGVIAKSEDPYSLVLQAWKRWERDHAHVDRYIRTPPRRSKSRRRK